MPVFLISLKAGNTGLNLVGASVVVHADPWWNAAAQNQATDRAHRIGQTQDVNVYQIVAKDTIEERILKLQEKKNELARQFTDGTASARTICSTCCHNMPAVAACAGCVPNRKTKTERRLRISHGGRIYGQASFREGENPYWR